MSENSTDKMPADLLNQILIELREVKTDLRELSQRVDRLEVKFLETNKLDKILGELADLRAEVSEFKTEVRREFREIKIKLIEQERERLILEGRVDNIEEQLKPKQ